MVLEFQNRVELLFTGVENGFQLKEKLDLVEKLLSGDSSTVASDQCKLFLEAIELVLNNAVKTITNKLLFTEEKTANYDLKLIFDCLIKISSVITKSIAIYTSLQSFQLEYVSRVFGPPIVKLFLIFQDHSLLPNEDDSVISSLMSTFLRVMHKTTLKVYLDTISNPLYVKILKYVIVDLARDGWKMYPFTCHAYERLIALSSREQLSNVLPIIFPPILRFVDDFQSKFVVLGIRILRNIFSVVPSAEIRMFGWADVIYDALFKKLYLRDAKVLDMCLPCLLAVLKVLERDPKKSDKQRSLTRYDDVFQLLVSNLTMISENQTLRIIWKHLPSYIEVMGITISRHLKDLIHTIEYHLEVGYLKHLPFIFQTINITVQVAWIRSKHHTATLLKSLLKLALRVKLNRCEDDGIYDGIRRCISLLYQCNSTIVKTTLAKVGELPEWSKGRLHHVISLPFPTKNETKAKF